jgi:GTP pyrophosphokinase
MKRLDYKEMLEKLLKNYYAYNPQELGLIERAFGVPKKRKIFEKALKLIKKQRTEELGSELITRAFWYAKRKHARQKRISGDPYFIHPYKTALYLTELKMDASSIAAGFLHDVVEDTATGINEIKEGFGDDVASLVESLTKLRHIVSMNKRKEYNLALQKILFATTKDIRVIIIKLADKYHNLQTLHYLPKEKQKMIASNALEFYVPVAKKLGLHELKDSFEKICFKTLKPKIHAKIWKTKKEKIKQKETEMDLMIKKLEEECRKAGIKVSFRKYRRTAYAIFKKMTQNLKSFTEVQDSVVLIALTESKEACYEFLGILHNTFSPFPLKFRDHIAISQLSLYQSIHTTVMGPQHSPIKVYIRTKEMDALVKNGVAELLRKSKFDENSFKENISLLNNLMSVNFDDLPIEHFIEVLKTDYLQDRILVFNRQGNLIELPKGSSVIDFAYALDTETAQKARKAMVNGKLVPLWHELKNGDLVDVITGKKKTVSALWEKFAVSVKARNEIHKQVKGKIKAEKRMPLVNLEVKTVDRIGVVRDITDVFVFVGANIFSAEVKTNGKTRLGNDVFTLELENPTQLGKLLKKLKKIKGVIEVKAKYIR